MASGTERPIYLQIKTPLPDDTFEVLGFSGEEQISAPFHYRVVLGSHDVDVDFSALLGKGVTVTITHEDGTVHARHAIVVRFSQSIDESSQIVYVAELSPWLWLLTKSSDCRIFQNQNVPDIITTVFSDLGFTDYRLDLGSYSPREYCVQYSESHFDFVSRLMEDEGIFYFFEHEEGKHTLVIADHADAHVDCPGLAEALHFRAFGASWEEEDAIQACTLEQQVIVTEYRMTDYNFETPTTDLAVTIQGEDGGGAKLAVLEYPGGYMKKDEGEKRAKTRIELHEAGMRSVQGESKSRHFIAGYKFALSKHGRAELNTSYVIRALHISATPEGYSNSFVAIPASVPFRPPKNTRRPYLAGYQVATVVGKSGEEIWTDDYGRVKVHFPWDSRSRKDENSSCWVRVAQAWTGKGWGNMFIPRIDSEVLVSFLDGDPDRPLIVGSVYNGQQTTPYPLPDDKTRSTIKSNSSKGGGGFNEIRLEDKKGSEEIFVNAQKNYNVEVGNNRTTNIAGTNRLTVGKDDTEEFQANRTIAVAKDDSESYGANRTITVAKDESETYDANQTISVGKNQTITISGDQSESVSGKMDVSVTKEYTMQAKKVTIVADDEISIKTGSAEIVMKKSGDITIKGNKIQVKGSGDIILKGSQIKEN